jgi:hypothetical protein
VSKEGPVTKGCKRYLPCNDNVKLHIVIILVGSAGIVLGVPQVGNEAARATNSFHIFVVEWADVLLKLLSRVAKIDLLQKKRRVRKQEKKGRKDK